MPISRCHIRSAHSLADPELQRAADKDDSEALLEAVAMAGIVGVLRQLGDLSQFATEVFHDLHEEVMATAARGHSLMSRVQQLEAEVPALEKAFLSQTHHSSFFTNGGIDWHPNLQSQKNLVTRGDLPRFIMDSYEECRGPPRLFLLDKFDVAGAGACLKRYTDPSFFKVESASSGTAMVEAHREKRIRKVKKKGARPMNGETPKVVTSHSKLHQLLLEERIENACSDPARLVKLRKKQLNGSAFEAKTGKSYMEKILEIPSRDHKLVCETSVIPLPVKSMPDDANETGIKILEISSITRMKRSLGNENTCLSPNEQELELKPYPETDRETNGYLVKAHGQIFAGVTDEMSSNHPKVPGETELVGDEPKKIECSLDGYHSDDMISEADDYVDALATMESELETDNECKPMKSLVNIQKVTDSNGKEEHQLQTRFSDSPSFGDSLTSEEISSFEQDRNEDHNEVQAPFSDSESTRTYCASDDNNSFRRDRNEEHIQLQAQFSDSQSIGNTCTSEIKDMPSNLLSQTVELEKTYCGEFVMRDDAQVQGEEISDSRQVSSGSCLDSGCLLLSSDLGASSPVFLPTGTQSDEKPTGPVEPRLRLGDDDNRCLVEPIAAVHDSLSPIKDDACRVVSFDNNSLNNLDICDPYVHSDALLQVSNDLNLARENECGYHSDIKVLQAESLNEYSSEILVNGDVGSQGEDPICPSMEVDLNSGTKLLLDGQDLKSEHAITATQLNSEDLSPLAETTPVSSFTEELCSSFTHKNPLDEPDSAEVKIVYSDQQSNFEEVPRIMPGDETSGSTCSLDPIEDGNHIKHLSSPDYIRQDNYVMINDMFTEKVQSEGQDVSAPPSIYCAENDASIVRCQTSDFISSPSRNLSNLHEPLLGSSDSHQMEMESNELELTKNSVDLNAEKREIQLESSSDIISSPMSSLTKMEDSLSAFADPCEEEMEVNEAVAIESLTELVAQKVVDQPEVASTDVESNLNRSVPSDHFDSGICNNIQHSSLKDKIQYGSCINDMKMVQVCSELDSMRSESISVCQNDLQNSKYSFSPPSYYQLEHETHLDLFLKSQVGQQDAGFLLRNEENYTSEKFQPQRMQISNQLEQERISDFASEFAAEIHPDEPSSCDSSLKSSGEEVDPTKHVIDPLKPLLPDLFPKETKVNLEEMPPLPPLPPRQWRMGKVQHASLFSQREEIEVSQAFLQPIQPVIPDEKLQFGPSTSERETLLTRNPFLPVMAVESNKPQNSSGFSAGLSQHPVAIPLQFPIMINEANSQYNYLFLERSQIQNSFLTLPVLSSGKPPHGYLVASEGEMVFNSIQCPPILPAECAVSGADPIFQEEKPTQSPNQLIEVPSLEVKQGRPGELHLVLPADCPVPGDDSISPKEKPTQSPSQLMEESSLGVITLEQSLVNLGRDQGDPSISPVSPPSTEIVQPNPSRLSSEEEMASSLDTSVQTSEFDNEMPNGKLKNKLPRPRNPLIDVVAALDKSKLRKVTERVWPQIEPKVDERDSLLEQIRTKSFNLKPAVVARPRVQGPKTNLRVAAILEKANAIRQALAGSDEDDDADSWSDS
ncbi:protein SCAR2-like isoform X2 [Gastrolobium bilobum]|uniref:protein SCAR2-like isoform X2 n=1 Tax=Gastrolobium bilobum TaxID=150636 RepID=UPI002AB14A71|nr:protein SCAR2-like isoform X2 [Gastrolobium bilobum]